MLTAGPQELLALYDNRTAIATAVVALGIFGEYACHFYFERPTKKDLVKTLLTLFFGALVLGGVVGEFVFGKKISLLSKGIQQTSDQTVAALKLQLGTVNLEIAKANAQAAAAGKQASEANERALNAEKETAKAQTKAAEASERAIATAKEQSKIASMQIDLRIESSRPGYDDEKQASILRTTFASVFLRAILEHSSKSSKPPILFGSYNLVADLEREEDNKIHLIYVTTFKLKSTEIIGNDVSSLADIKDFDFHFPSFAENVVHEKDFNRVVAILYVNGRTFKIVDYKRREGYPITSFVGLSLTSPLTDIGSSFGLGLVKPATELTPRDVKPILIHAKKSPAVSPPPQ